MSLTLCGNSYSHMGGERVYFVARLDPISLSAKSETCDFHGRHPVEGIGNNGEGSV